MRKWIDIVENIEELDEALDLYHGTYGDFDAFDRSEDIGYHFGTKDAAVDRLSCLYRKRNKPAGSPKIYHFEVDLKNPLRMRDQGLWTAAYIADELVRIGLIKEKQKKMSYDQLRQIIVSAGYDGIVYANAWEGKRHLGDHETIYDVGVVVRPNKYFNKGSSKAYVAYLNDYPFAYGQSSDEAASNALSLLRSERQINTDSFICFDPAKIQKVATVPSDSYRLQKRRPSKKA